MKLAPDAELLTEVAGSLRFRIPQPKTMGGGGGGGASGSEVALDAPPASSVSLSSGNVALSGIYRALDSKRRELYVMEWALQSSTLEEAFVQLTGDFERNFQADSTFGEH